MTFREIYMNVKNESTPAQKFIEEVADVTCRNTRTVQQWISGTQQPPIQVQEKLAEKFGFPVDELFPKLQLDECD